MNAVAKIKVFGVGGGGCNAVNRMFVDGVSNIEFHIANTDQQVLDKSPVFNKITLGKEITKGLGAGGDPEVGRKAAEESEEELRKAVEGANMVFITAGLGGGTGTGAAPVIARLAKEIGALTIAVVTKPFSFEGKKRSRSAEEGLARLRQHVDSIIIVSNDNLLAVIGNKPIVEGFEAADNVLRQAVQTITDLITIPSFINLDFADVKSVMQNRGAALIGVGMAEGEDKAVKAAQQAVESPLLEIGIQGAKSAILNITGGTSVSVQDCYDTVEAIKEACGNDIDVIYGYAENNELGDSIIVSIIATGFSKEEEEEIVQINPSMAIPKSSSSTASDKESKTFPRFPFNSNR